MVLESFFHATIYQKDFEPGKVRTHVHSFSRPMRLAVQWIQPRADAVRREYAHTDGPPSVTMTYNYQEEAKKRQLSEAKATLRKTLAGESGDEQPDRISLEDLESARQRLIKENQSKKSYALRKAKKQLEDTFRRSRLRRRLRPVVEDLESRISKVKAILEKYDRIVI